jgi:hypothetical protein
LKSGAEDLLEGAGQLFPKMDTGRLGVWLKSLREPASASETLLFIALVCGTRFGIRLPEVNDVLRQLWEWLTWNPRNMSHDLADLVVDALAPALERELEGRENWRVGVTALVADSYFREVGLGPAEATERSLELAAILTGRELAVPEELRRAKRELGIPDLRRLIKVIREQYEWWVERDAIVSGDQSSPSEPAARAARALNHRSLRSALKKYGARTLAELAVNKIPNEAWGNASVPKRPSKSARQVAVVSRSRRRSEPVRK